jgi:hypothetical protein
LPADRSGCSLGSAVETRARLRGGTIVITALIGVVIVTLAVLLAVAGLTVVQRLVPLPLRQSHNDATGTIFAALYVMLGVTLGFSLFLVWQQYDAAQRLPETEAAHVEALYQLAGSLPEPERGQVRDLAASYARVVVEEEWPLMAQGRTSERLRALARPSSGAASRTSRPALKPSRRSRARD